MRYPLAIALSALAMASVSLAGDKVAWNAEALSAWVGKYPTETVGKKTVSILDEAPVKRVLAQVVPQSERKLLATFDTEAPVAKVGSMIVINKCKPHACPSDLAMVVVDLERTRLWVGFFSRTDDYVSTRWYGNADDYSTLPEQIRQEFLTRHGD